MISGKSTILFFIALLTVLPVQAQNSTNDLLRKVYNKMKKAKDYSVEANIKVDIPFIRMLPVDVEIYYKQPDKFKVKSKSIAIVPRQGFDQAARMLADTNAYTSMTQGVEKIGTIEASIVNIIPLSDTSDLILGKLWIDPVACVILKSQLTTKSNGTILTEYTYGKQASYGLPDNIVFSVDMKKFKVPKGVAMNMDDNNSAKDNNNKKEKKGKIYITLSDYHVNTGIPDSLFDK